MDIMLLNEGNVFFRDFVIMINLDGDLFWIEIVKINSRVYSV
jgi:hypothetical protein